ncbi:hypothetical protein GLV89_11765 [Halomonas alkaliantarctica]|nr:hypothetical protein [Halomonas alkaliantarctica]
MRPRNANGQLEEVLTEGLSATWQRLHRHQIAAILRFYHQEERRAPSRDQDSLRRTLLATLLDWLTDRQREMARLRAAQEAFRRRLNRARSEAEIQAHVLDHARDLGASGFKLQGDRRALKRWFGADAVSERYRRQYAACERHLSVSLERLGVLGAAHLQAEEGGESRVLERWQRLALERHLSGLLEHDGDHNVRLAAFKALSACIRALSAHEACLSNATLSSTYRLAMDHAEPVWLQTEALSLLSALGHEEVLTIIERRLASPAKGDDFFVRQHAVKVLATQEKLPPALLESACRDDSPTVRQALIELLVERAPQALESLLEHLTLKDEAQAVRNLAVHALPRLVKAHAHTLPLVRRLLESGTREETCATTLRLYCHGIPAIAFVLLEQERQDDFDTWAEEGLGVLTRLNTQALDFRVRRWAAQARERLWCLADPEARALHEHIKHHLDNTPAKKTRRLKLPRAVDADRLGRVLGLFTQQDFGLDVNVKGRRLSWRRWERFRFRLWRLWYEMTHASASKRQAGYHTLGRVYYGLLQVPSARLAELSATQVPGEPLQMPEEAGWRPYLPLVDQLISSLDQGWPTQPMHLYTSEGVTEITPPKGFIARLKARLKLTFGFSRYARLRNWEPGRGMSVRGYVEALRRLGFQVRFRPHTDFEGHALPADPAVTRFFSLAWLSPLLLEWWQRYTDYFVSLYQNSLRQLMVFLGGMGALFLGRHAVTNATTRRARNGLALVIGGWGTRGKSGTERLKAALFNGLGLEVLSKSTGSETVLLHGESHRPLQEMLLFRPYDKATIWEQASITKLARKLDVDVFLWECMGLRAFYVQILQKQWMRDDIATITNTYPDHEDIQGPAGIDIPQVMTEFIPRRATLVTSEEEMLPILEQTCRKLGTRCFQSNWINIALLPEDILARFPYAEHPANIALVVRLAETLGLSPLFALKAMADHVIPDLGALKEYPPARVRGRTLAFTNGMSANERLGALGNWRRMGFDTQDPQKDPGVWVTTLINNRADRQARSRVFADILVNDISADRHFLIGTNLEGLMDDIERAWERRYADASLFTEEASPRDTWRRQAQHLRVPTSREAVIDRLAAMLEGLEVTPDKSELDEHLDDPSPCLAAFEEELSEAYRKAVLEQHRLTLKEWQAFDALDQRLASRQSAASLEKSALEKDARELLWQWFKGRLEVVPSPTVSGEALVDLVAERTPPGYTNRIIGMQNIKGTGLDWVYRWQAWDSLYHAGEKLLHGDSRQARQALKFLGEFKAYGVLSMEYMQALLKQVRERPLAQEERAEAELELIEKRLEARRKALEKTDDANVAAHRGLWQPLLGFLEAFLDVGDAVRRRRRADRIYRDLTTQRISSTRAAKELKYLDSRQKGGWLSR